MHALAAQPFDADILAVLHGIKDLAPKPMPARLREWQAAGGRLEIQNARLAQAESLANATGTLALTQQGRLDGALRLTVAGIERFMPTIGGEKGASLSLDRVAPALNAIERAVPGLAQRIAPQRQQALQTGLLALARTSRRRSRASRASRRRCASPTARPRSARSRSDKCRRRFRTMQKSGTVFRPASR